MFDRYWSESCLEAQTDREGSDESLPDKKPTHKTYLCQGCCSPFFQLWEVLTQLPSLVARVAFVAHPPHEALGDHPTLLTQQAQWVVQVATAGKRGSQCWEQGSTSWALHHGEEGAAQWEKAGNQQMSSVFSPSCWFPDSQNQHWMPICWYSYRL